MTARKCFTLMLFILSIGFMSCDLDVPLREMVTARTLISRARFVMAEKYDPENLNRAVEHLFDSHTLLLDKKSKKAKESAEKAANFAELAINVSLPRAAADTLAEAKKTYGEAERLNAEVFAPDQFSGAAAAIGESEKLTEGGDLMGAFLKAREAVASGAEAKEISMSNIPRLTDRIAEMNGEIDRLGEKKLTDQQKQSLAGARTGLEKAGALIVEGNLKDAVGLISESEEALKSVRRAATIVTTRERIAQIRKDVDALKKKRGSEYAGEDIDQVLATLNEAESLLEQDRAEEATKKIDDAEILLAVAKDKTWKGIAMSKADSVERLLAETRKRDSKGKFSAEIDRAGEMISDGKKLMENESYTESLVKFEEAESLLYSLGIVSERDRVKDDEKIRDLEGKKVYKVVYNRKRRDCLWRIAGKVYNDARLWPLIYMANRDQIKDPDLIFPGQRFVIPDIPEKKGPRPDEKAGDPAIKEDDEDSGGNGVKE